MISIHLMLLFNTLKVNSLLMFHDFNTSNVTIQPFIIITKSIP